MPPKVSTSLRRAHDCYRRQTDDRRIYDSKEPNVTYSHVWIKTLTRHRKRVVASACDALHLADWRVSRPESTGKGCCPLRIFPTAVLRTTSYKTHDNRTTIRFTPFIELLHYDTDDSRYRTHSAIALVYTSAKKSKVLPKTIEGGRTFLSVHTITIYLLYRPISWNFATRRLAVTGGSSVGECCRLKLKLHSFPFVVNWCGFVVQ